MHNEPRPPSRQHRPAADDELDRTRRLRAARGRRVGSPRELDVAAAQRSSVSSRGQRRTRAVSTHQTLSPLASTSLNCRSLAGAAALAAADCNVVVLRADRAAARAAAPRSRRRRRNRSRGTAPPSLARAQCRLDLSEAPALPRGAVAEVVEQGALREQRREFDPAPSSTAATAQPHARPAGAAGDRSSLHAAQQQALDVVALQRQEQHQHRQHGDHRRRPSSARCPARARATATASATGSVCSVLVGQHDQRPHEVVPAAEEREDRQRDQHRLEQRQHDRTEDAQLARAVDARGFEQLVGDACARTGAPGRCRRRSPAPARSRRRRC